MFTSWSYPFNTPTTGEGVARVCGGLKAGLRNWHLLTFPAPNKLNPDLLVHLLLQIEDAFLSTPGSLCPGKYKTCTVSLHEITTPMSNLPCCLCGDCEKP